MGGFEIQNFMRGASTFVFFAGRMKSA